MVLLVKRVVPLTKRVVPIKTPLRGWPSSMATVVLLVLPYADLGSLAARAATAGGTSAATAASYA